MQTTALPTRWQYSAFEHQVFQTAPCLCGVGDTVALLMADQAFPLGNFAAVAKIGVLAGSALAAMLGAAVVASVKRGAKVQV